jgi:hypothetical protein
MAACCEARLPVSPDRVIIVVQTAPKEMPILLPIVTLTCFYELEPIISLFSGKSFADLSQLGGSRNIHALCMLLQPPINLVDSEISLG